MEAIIIKLAIVRKKLFPFAPVVQLALVYFNGPRRVCCDPRGATQTRSTWNKKMVVTIFISNGP